MMTTDDLKIGRAYRAKRPAPAGPISLVNDRQIKWLDASTLQYDSPSVAEGRHFPRVSIESFLEWASHDVTDELPPGDWESWRDYLRKRAEAKA